MNEKAIVIPASRLYYEKVIPSIKAALVNSDVERIYLLIEDDEYPGYLPDCVTVKNARTLERGVLNQWSGNYTRTPYVYLCLLRCAFAKIFPHDRILSLDADAIIARKIGSEPWTMGFDDNYLAGVAETKISAQLCRPYINAGVMLLNLEQIRENASHELIFNINNCWYQWLEQDCFNIVCKNHIKVLGSEWNACQFTEPCDNPKIRHFAYEQNWLNDPLIIKYRDMDWCEVMEGRT